MKRQAPEVFVYPDRESLASAVAALVAAEARGSVERSGRFSLALAGGATPRQAYRLLASPDLAGLVPWAAVHVFWGDERCVAPTDPLSNEGMARETLLAHVPVPTGQIHPIRCGTGGGAAGRVAAAAATYEALLRDSFPAMDLVLLGLGADGHTASLFPGSEALQERERWVVPVPSQNGAGVAPTGAARAGPGLERITLTLPYLNRARVVAFLVAGGDKASAVQRVVQEAAAGRSPQRSAPDILPAARVRPSRGRVLWYLDVEAAALLDPSPVAPGLETRGASALAPGLEV